MLILDLVIIFFLAKLGGHISVKLGQSSVLGEILVGILIGPTLFGLVEPSVELAAFSTIGVILLMFIAGLETDLVSFKNSAKASSLVAIGGIVFPLFLGYAAGLFLGFESTQSWILGVILSATSVSISVQAMREMNMLQTKEGSVILGAAVLDDIVVMVILAFLMSLALGGDVSLTTVLMKKFLFFVIAIFVAWKVVPTFLKTFSKLQFSEPVMTSGIIVCFIFSYFAEYTGVAAIIGAYIAGLAISQTTFKQEIFEKTETIGFAIFIPVFFAYIGISAEFNNLLDNLWLIIGLTVLAISTKFIGAGLGAKFAGFGWRSSFGIGSAMVSRGEVALIVSSLALGSQLISEEFFSIVVFVVVITTIVTPPMMKLFFDSKNIQK